jgi:hypothetical protein
VIGLLVILRHYFAIPLLVLCFLILVTSKNFDRGLYSLNLFKGITPTLLPWLTLQFKDTGTVLYPFFKGNMNPEFPYMGPTSYFSILQQLEISFVHILKSNILQVLIISSMTLLYLSKNNVTSSFKIERQNDRTNLDSNRSTYLPYYLIKLISSFLISYFVLAIFLRGWGGPWAFTRYWSPFLVAILTFTTLAIVQDVIVPQARTLLTQRFFSFWWVVSIFSLAFQLNLSVLTTHYVKGFETLRAGEIGKISLSDPIRENSKNVRKVVESIPKGSKVFVASEYPVGFLDSGFDFQFADIAGAATRDELFPFFANFETKVEWLKSQNFDYVVFSGMNADSCLFSKSTWESSLGQKTMTGTWAPYVLDWISFMDSFRMKHPEAVTDYDQIFLLEVGMI